MKKQKAYAIFNVRGKLAVIQSTLPIYWKRYVAEERAKAFPGYKVVKIEIDLDKDTSAS